MELQGRTALVTGGAHRVGGALSRALAGAGAAVIVNYRRSADAAAAMVREIEATGGRAVAVPADVSVEADVDRLIARALEAFGRLDVVVNSASRFDRAPLAGVSPADWDRTLAVNLRGPFLVAQAARSALAETRGSIVNIVDLSAFQPWPSYVPHAVSKAGLLHLTRCLARAYAPRVRVNAIAPGTVLPPEDFDGSDNAGGMDRRVLQDRAGTPEDVADALLYLLRAEFVTGECMIVDGGRHLL